MNTELWTVVQKIRKSHEKARTIVRVCKVWRDLFSTTGCLLHLISVYEKPVGEKNKAARNLTRILRKQLLTYARSKRGDRTYMAFRVSEFLNIYNIQCISTVSVLLRGKRN